MAKSNKINVKGTEITVFVHNETDYIFFFNYPEFGVIEKESGVNK